MPEQLKLKPDLYAEATPAGAYYAAASPVTDPARRMLQRILRDGHGAPIDDQRLCFWATTNDLQMAMQVLYRLQRLGFIRGSEKPRQPPEGSLENLLPPLLARLSDIGRTLLADDNGFYIAAAGFHHEAAEEVAALAGDLLTISQHHSLLLKNNLNLSSSAWALTDPTGQAELGFYPLHVNDQAFVLIIGGTPNLQSDDFVTLVQTLNRRYG
jgi:hypothetical protein